MVDKGFDIEDLLSSKQVSLNLPPFLQIQTQFSAQDVLQTKNYCKSKNPCGTCNRKYEGISFI